MEGWFALILVDGFDYFFRFLIFWIFEKIIGGQILIEEVGTIETHPWSCTGMALSKKLRTFGVPYPSSSEMCLFMSLGLFLESSFS